MDRLISEQAVIDRLTRWYSDMLETGKEQEDLIEVIKAIPLAEPYKGMTNGEVIIKIFPYILPKVFDGTDDAVIFSLDWWNSPYRRRE